MANIKVERNAVDGNDFQFQILTIDQNLREIDSSAVANDEHLLDHDKRNLPAENNIKNEITIEEFDFSQATKQYEVEMEKLNMALSGSSPNIDQNITNLIASKDQYAAELIIKDEFTETETHIITKNPIGTAEESNASATIIDGNGSSVSKYKFQNTKIHTNKIPKKKTRVTQKKNVDSQITTRYNKKSFICSYCEKVYTSKHNLVAHMRVHTGESKPFPCSHCDKKFISKRDLVSHIRTHTGEKPFECAYCENKFTLKRYLDLHIRIHSGEKPYACIYCEKAFTTKKSLVDHMINHTGEKPYACINCGKAVSTKQSLVRHMLLHTGERPFACIHCEKAFTTKHSLVEHIRIHTGERPYACIHCEKAFPCKQSLVKHMGIHTGERPYACIHCEKAFPDKHRLRTHTRIHTGAKS